MHKRSYLRGRADSGRIKIFKGVSNLRLHPALLLSSALLFSAHMHIYDVCALVGAVWMVAWLHVALELAGMLHAA